MSSSLRDRVRAILTIALTVAVALAVEAGQRWR